MTILEQAKQIIAELVGITSSLTVSNAISALNDLLALQKRDVQEAHKAVNAAKEREDEERLTYKMMENLLDKAKRQRQELRDEKYSNGL